MAGLVVILGAALLGAVAGLLDLPRTESYMVLGVYIAVMSLVVVSLLPLGGRGRRRWPR